MLQDFIEPNLIPEYISECSAVSGAPYGSHCTSETSAQKIGKAIGVAGSRDDIIEAALKKTGCRTERCMLEKMTGVLGPQIVRAEVALNLKVPGPTGSELLSNVNIDAVLQQWALKFSEFFPYNFNMRDYASYSFRDGRVINSPDTLATVPFTALYSGEHNGRQYKCAACVINSDRYHGPGKHWMALFADARNGRRTVEFFNSSGNAPAPEWVNWMQKTKTMLELLGGPAEAIKVSNIRHQDSRSECGVYSLFYIWARLHGVPPEAFAKKKIHDRFMFEFRQHLFADPARPAPDKFDWDNFQKHTKIKWEP